MKDELLRESANLPSAGVIAQEITDDLETAREQLTAMAGSEVAPVDRAAGIESYSGPELGLQAIFLLESCRPNCIIDKNPNKTKLVKRPVGRKGCTVGKIIIVAGVPGAGKSTLLYEAAKRVEKDLNYTIVSFGSEMLTLCQEAGQVKDRDEMRNLNPDVQEEMQWRTTKRIAERPENILLDTHCAIKTGFGSYVPGMTPRMLERLSPKALILVDAHEAEIRGRRKLDKSRPLRTIEAYDDILEHKVINRAYAAAFSARSGCLLKIIQNNTGEFEKAVEEFVGTLRFIGIEAFTPPGPPRQPAPASAEIPLK